MGGKPPYFIDFRLACKMARFFLWGVLMIDTVALATTAAATANTITISKPLVMGLSLNIFISLAVSAIVVKFSPFIPGLGQNAGKAVGAIIVNAVNTEVDASLRGAVIAELQQIATDVTAQSQTVAQTAQQILGKLAPSIPTASIGQIATIIGEFVKTFEAGLSASLVPVASASTTTTSVVATQSVETKVS